MRNSTSVRTARARELRQVGPDAERRLWTALRARQLGGCKFVRQEPIGPFFADFVCREHKLIVEIDGATHSTPQELTSDALREAQLNALGYRLLRINNQDVYENMDGVLESILLELQPPQHPLSPSGRGLG
jgi:very-short-patch-repair endonuclease